MTDKIVRYGTLHPQKEMLENTDWKPVYGVSGIIQTLPAAMGMGGGYVPFVVIRRKNGTKQDR